MNHPDASWRAEKAGFVIMSACRLLRNKQATVADFRIGLIGVIENASKLICCAYEEKFGDSGRWSPDLTQFLVDHPERAEDTLKVISSEDYQDSYFDKRKDWP